MSEPLPHQPSLAPPVPTPADEPGVPCERCGTFIQEEPRKVDVHLLCETCAPLLRKEIRLYPTWYVFVLGIVVNFTIASALSAINWKRLGDRTRMRNASILAVCGVAWTVLVMGLEFKAKGGYILTNIINIIGTTVAAQALDGAYKQHKQQGGSRANLLWPPLIAVSAILAVGISYDLFFELTRPTPE